MRRAEQRRVALVWNETRHAERSRVAPCLRPPTECGDPAAPATERSRVAPCLRPPTECGDPAAPATERSRVAPCLRPPTECGDPAAPATMITFTPEQEEFRKAVARLVDAEVVPAAEAIDERAEFPWTLFKRLGELGYLGLRYPAAYGGADADMVTYCLFAEELARGSLSVAATVAMQSLMGTYFIYKYGTEELRRKYLVPALRGDLVATFALTEPNAGSDVANIM